MSENSTVDILQPLPVEKWHLLQEKTKFKWPLFAYYHYWVENSIKWKKIDPNIDVAIYCPYGNYEKGTFVAINSYAAYMVLIFTLDPNGDNISKILTETKIIDWTRPLQLATVHQTIAPVVLSALEDLKRLKNLEAQVLSFNYYFKPAEESAKVEICVPDECYLKPLDESDIILMHSVWPHRYLLETEVTLKHFHTWRVMNGGLGLNLKEDNSLVSWVIQNDWHGLAIVQTAEKHKRKGYAKVVVTALAKRFGEQGIPTNLFIVEGNTASERMFQSLGWKAISPVPNECYLKPLDEPDIELIHSVWPHRDIDKPEMSLKYLQTLRIMNGGLGLYLKEDNSLVSWVMQNDWHGLAIVQTVEKHKRKGYAKVVVNALAKRLGEQGIPTNLFIVKGNTASEKMFQNLGWKAISPFVWIQCKKLKLVNPTN